MVCVGLAAADLPTGTPESVGRSSARLARIDAAMQADIAAGRPPAAFRWSMRLITVPS